MATPHYQWIVVDPINIGGAGVAELTEARTRRLDFALDDAGTANWTMPGRHPQTALIEELQTDLIVARDGVTLYRGRVLASDDTISPNVHTCTFQSVDYRGMLDRRIIWTGSTNQFTQIDQSAIAATLIADSQKLGTLGINTSGVAATGVKRDRTYDVGATIGELIGELGRVTNGFDWDVSPSLALRVFWPARGVQTPTFIAEYGRNVADVRRTVASSDFANAIRFSGKDGVPAALRSVTPGAEGRWERQLGNPDLTLAATVGEQADAALVTLSNIAPSYNLTLVSGVFNPAAVWLGDTIRVICRSGRIDVDTNARVVGVSIDIGENGEETVSLQVGRYRWRLTERLATYQLRLDRLERT